MNDLFVWNMCGLSVAFNIVLVILLYKSRKKPRAQKPDATAQQVLSELMAGPAVVKIEVIEKDSLILWRPN